MNDFGIGDIVMVYEMPAAYRAVVQCSPHEIYLNVRSSANGVESRVYRKQCRILRKKKKEGVRVTRCQLAKAWDAAGREVLAEESRSFDFFCKELGL